MLTGLLVLAMIVLKGFPKTAAADWGQRALAALFDRLAKIERKHLIFLALMAIILIVGQEVLAMAGPLDMGLVIMWDVSTYIDIALASATLATVARGRAGWRLMLARVTRRRAGTPRARRHRAAPERASPPANDDDRVRFATAA